MIAYVFGNTGKVANLRYAPGRRVDLYGDPTGETVLLWHGMQSNARASVRRLAEALARHGLDVVVPDWHSHACDGGRADLLQSAAFAQDRADPSGIVLVGWSMGGLAAADLTIHATDFGVVVSHTVCLAGAFTVPGPITGGLVGAAAATSRADGVFTLLHGRSDDVVPADVSAGFATALEHASWPVSVVDLDTDHGAIAGARYDESGDRYEPADDGAALAVAADVAGLIAKFTGCGTRSATRYSTSFGV